MLPAININLLNNAQLINLRFTYLIILHVTNRKCILVRCDCGKEFTCALGNLTRQTTRSCGCLRKQRSTKHGLSYTSEHSIWRKMMRRCYVVEDKDYPDYGGRGITVAPEWWDFPVFYADMSPRPFIDDDGYSIYTLDRIDNNGNYCKSNCKWSDKQTQARNRRVAKRRSRSIDNESKEVEKISYEGEGEESSFESERDGRIDYVNEDGDIVPF